MDSGRLAELAAWAMAALVAAVILAIVAFWVRRRYRANTGQAGLPWTLQELQEMRARGELTEPEYRALRTKVVNLFTSERDRRRPGPGR